MTAAAVDSLCDPVLKVQGIEHGFGQRGSQPPDSTFFPEQVHGIEVCQPESFTRGGLRPRADVILSRTSDTSVGIVTADCVPILVASVDGRVVMAIHAGWRGLSAGVIEAGLDAIRVAAPASRVVAAIGPAAGRCCYEVDEPVRGALALRYPDALDSFLDAGRPGRFKLDLAGLVTHVLSKNGVKNRHIGSKNSICTICSGARFESYRREGPAAGRLIHFISRPRSADSQAREG